MRYPAYPKYKDSGVEWLGEVPEGWRLEPLGFHIHLTSGSTPDKANSEYWEGEIPWVSPKDMKVPRIHDAEDHVSELALTDSTLKLIPVNSILVVVRGMILAHSFPVAITTGVVTINQDMKAIFTNISITPEFLYWWFVGLASAFVSLADESAHGTRKIETETIRKFPLLLASTDEQTAIASFLDRETGRIDRLVGKKRELIERLKEKRTALISRTVTRGLPPAAARAAGLPENPPLKPSGVDWLGKIPEHWAVERIATNANKITNGYVGPTRDILVDDGVKYLQSLHIKNNKILFHREYYVEPEWSKAHSKSILAVGDVLIVQTGDVGQAAAVTKEFEGCNCHALIIVALRPEKALGTFLSWFLNSHFGADELKRIETGALHPHLNCGLVRDVRLPLPPLAEQFEIASFLDEQTLKLDSMISKVEQAIERLLEYRTALITAAVTGKIDVRDVKD